VVRLALAAAVLLMGAAAACSGASDPVTGGGPSAATIVTVQSKVLTPRCALTGCHVGTTAPFGLDMSSASKSAANLIGVASGEKPAVMRVAAGDAAESYMYWKITANPSIGGDPMPLTGGPLSDADISLVAAWIDGGAK
jgi:hypothetical protein